VIFLDTSAIIALAHRGDPNHAAATQAFREVVEGKDEFFTHNYVLIEATALLQRRLGLATAEQFLKQSQQFRIHWMLEQDHRESVELLQERGKRGLSLVDCASFVVMRRFGLTQALAFDADFESEGFIAYRSSNG